MRVAQCRRGAVWDVAENVRGGMFENAIETLSVIYRRVMVQLAANPELSVSIEDIAEEATRRLQQEGIHQEVTADELASWKAKRYWALRWSSSRKSWNPFERLFIRKSRPGARYQA